MTGRFINADDTIYLGTSDSVSSYNLYTYGNNNPVNYVDYFGNNPTAIVYGIVEILLIIGIVVIGWIIANMLTQIIILLVKLIWNVGEKVIDVAQDVVEAVKQAVTKAEKKPDTTETERHHIIARTAMKMAKAREIWVEKCKYSINNIRNLVDINKNLHKALHTNLWYTSMDNYI